MRGLTQLVLLLLYLQNFRGGISKTVETCSYREFQTQFPCGTNKLYKDEHKFAKCLYFSKHPKSWRDAQSECERSGGYLLSSSKGSDILQSLHKSNAWRGYNRYLVLPDGSVQAVANPRKLERYCEIFKTFSLDTKLCKQSNDFVCETDSGRRLYPPSLELKYSDITQQTFEGGKNLKAFCQGFVGMDGRLFFKIENKHGKVSRYSLLHKEVIYLEDRKYVMNRDRCDRRSKAAFVTMATMEFSGQNLTCCVESSQSYIACSITYELKVKYTTKQPSIQVQYHSLPNYVYLSYTLKATCVAFTNPSDVPQWYMTDSNHVPKKVLNSTLQEQEFDAALGLKQTLEMQIKVLKSHNKTQLICKADTVSTKSDTLIVIEEPSIPQMTITLHILPKWVINWRQLRASCQVQIYHPGWINWEMTSVTRTIAWNGQNSGSVASEGLVAHIHNIPSKKGSNFESFFTVVVNSEFDGAFFACRVRYLNSPRSKEREKMEFIGRSKYLRVFYGPDKPKLSIGYSDERDPVVPDKVIPVTCSALVGTMGALTVGTVGSASEFVWTVDLKGNTRSNNQNSLNALKNAHVTMDRYSGPKIAVHMHMWFAPEDDGSVLHCFSYDTFSNFTASVASEQDKALRTSFLLSSTPDKVHLVVFLSLAAMVMLICGITLWYFAKRESQNKSNGRKEQGASMALSQRHSAIPQLLLTETSSTPVAKNVRSSFRNKERTSWTSAIFRMRASKISQDIARRGEAKGSFVSNKSARFFGGS